MAACPIPPPGIAAYPIDAQTLYDFGRAAAPEADAVPQAAQAAQTAL